MLFIWIVLGTGLLACASNAPNLTPEHAYISPTFESANQIPNPNLVAERATVKIEIATIEGEYISNGVIVGDGHFVITYAPGIFDTSSRVVVTHVGSEVVTAGSIIYIDEIFGLALIRVTDDLGIPVEISQNMPNLGEGLIIGDFLTIREESLAVTRRSTVAGFEFEGLVIRFDGIVGSGSVGGPALNSNGELVGIVTHGLGEGESGSLFSTESFKNGLAENLVKYNETVTANASRYELDLIGIPAHVTKPSDWHILSGFGYFDIRAPGPSGNAENPPFSEYKVTGIINIDSSDGETSEEILERAVAEFGEDFKRVPELVIPVKNGFDKCVLLMTVEEYARTAFERRGYVIPGGWVSDPGVYTGLCTGISKNQRVIIFAESHDVDDIINVDGLLKNIYLVQ